LQEFKKKDGYIAIQQPSLATATQFWNICNDNNCKTVLMLSKDISIHVSMIYMQYIHIINMEVLSKHMYCVSEDALAIYHFVILLIFQLYNI